MTEDQLEHLIRASGAILNEDAIHRYTNNALPSAHIIAELVIIAKEMRDGSS